MKLFVKWFMKLITVVGRITHNHGIAALVFKSSSILDHTYQNYFEEDDQHFTDSIMELYKNRHKSPENLAKWQQIEKELFNEAIKKDEVPMEPLVENPENIEQSAKNLTADIIEKKIQALPKQISTDEGFITHSSTSNCRYFWSLFIFLYLW